MASTIPFQLVFPTELVDLIDAAWMGDVMPQDGEERTKRLMLLSDESDHRLLFSRSKKKTRPRPLKYFSKNIYSTTDDPLPPGVTLPPDDLDDFGGLGSVLSLGRGVGGRGGQGGNGGTTGATTTDVWQDLALGELQ